MMKIGDAKALVANIEMGGCKSSEVLEAIKCVWGDKETKTRVKREYADSAVRFLLGYISVMESR